MIIMSEIDLDDARRTMRRLENEIENLTGGIPLDPRWGHVPAERWNPHGCATDDHRWQVWRAEKIWTAINEIAYRSDRSDCYRVALRCYASAREYNGRTPYTGGTLIQDSLSMIERWLERLVGDKPIAHAEVAS